MGVRDPGEIGIEGVLVVLLTDPDIDGVFTPSGDTAVTDANGNYIFDDLDPGAYQVLVDPSNFNVGAPLEGYLQTGDPDDFGTTAPSPDNLTTSPVVLAPGDVFLNADFGYTPPIDEFNFIGDSVFFDADGDALQDPDEPGIPGVSVTLIQDDNGNGVIDPGESSIATVISDESGNYLFPGLLDGDYIIIINDTNNILDELVASADPDAALDGQSSVINLGVGNSLPEFDLDQDFGYTPVGQDPGDGIIGDTIFLDSNNNGGSDPGEGIESVTVNLYDSTGTVLIDTTTTNENGTYAFGNLDPTLTYTVVVGHQHPTSEPKQHRRPRWRLRQHLRRRPRR